MASDETVFRIAAEVIAANPTTIPVLKAGFAKSGIWIAAYFNLALKDS